jgi:hypothetical protein
MNGMSGILVRREVRVRAISAQRLRKEHVEGRQERKGKDGTIVGFGFGVAVMIVASTLMM